MGNLTAKRRQRHERVVRRRDLETQLQHRQQRLQHRFNTAQQQGVNGKVSTTLALYGEDANIQDVSDATRTMLLRGCKPLRKLSLLHIYFLLQHPLHGMSHEHVFRTLGTRLTVAELNGMIRGLLCEPRVVAALLRATCAAPPASATNTAEVDSGAGVAASSVRVVEV